MKQLLAEHYPGTKLGISEWNWGADKTTNGTPTRPPMARWQSPMF
jgi:hypothetical protein